MLPTESFSTSFTLERQFCTFSYRPSLLDSATVWHLAVMPFQVLRSTELLSTPITGYLQGLPLHCRHPASLCELFDRCSDHFLSIPFTSTNFPQPLRLLRLCLPFTSTNFPQPLRLLRLCLPSLIPPLCLCFLPCGWLHTCIIIMVLSNLSVSDVSIYLVWFTPLLVVRDELEHLWRELEHLW